VRDKYFEATKRPDFDNHLWAPNQARILSSIEFNETEQTLEINDGIWGKETVGNQFGDAILLELYDHPLVQRTRGVEQLTLPERYATIPNTTDFYRHEHIWGSVVFVRKMIRKAENAGRQFSDREKIILQLRTFLSDLGHTAFSHLGDWLRQDFGGNEDKHDADLPKILEISGILDILRKYSIEPEEVIFPDKQDWIESPLPEICVDRVDYALREMSRWVHPYFIMGRHWDELFELRGDKLVMANKADARFFSAAFSTLATEHWGHPAHRLQLNLFSETIKGVLLEEGPALIEGRGYSNPIESMYTVDDDIVDAIRRVGELNHDLHSLMFDIGTWQRRAFALARSEEITNFLDNVVSGREDINFPHPLEPSSWKSEYIGVKPAGIDFIPVTTKMPRDFNQLPYALDISLPALKTRAVDPRYLTKSGRVARLSNTDKLAKKLLAQAQTIQGQSYVGRIYLSPDFVDQLNAKIDTINNEWKESITRPERQPVDLRRLIQEAGEFALWASRNQRVASEQSD
jgi:hypothetical protein